MHDDSKALLGRRYVSQSTNLRSKYFAVLSQDAFKARVIMSVKLRTLWAASPGRRFNYLQQDVESITLELLRDFPKRSACFCRAWEHREHELNRTDNNKLPVRSSGMHGSDKTQTNSPLGWVEKAVWPMFRRGPGSPQSRPGMIGGSLTPAYPQVHFRWSDRWRAEEMETWITGSVLLLQHYYDSTSLPPARPPPPRLILWASGECL